MNPWKRILSYFALIFCLSENLLAQPLIPQPVDLGIQNISQNNQMWCWAAAAQQIISWKLGSAPPQCTLVATAYAANAQYCCNYPNQCNAPGNMQQIQYLISSYVGSTSSLAPPANPSVLYNTLSQGRAIILFLQTSPQLGHFVVLRGMSWMVTPSGLEAMCYINDPMSVYTQPVPFANLLSIWSAAIVVN